MREIYDARRRLLMGALDEMGFTYGEPRGGLYVWANTAATGIPALELSSLFLEEDVLIFPGTGFGENWGHFVRMTLLQPIEVLAEAIDADEARAGKAANRRFRCDRAGDRDGPRRAGGSAPAGRGDPHRLRRDPGRGGDPGRRSSAGELRGHPGQGQGMRGLSRYCEMLENGGIVPGAPFEVLVDTPAMALVDGHKGFGQVIAVRAMDLAIAKAREVGVGLVGVRHSNHLGITAYHAMRAAEQRMIGLCLTNAGPEMAPWGGITPTIGTNPWGIAAPTDLGFPIVLDMALSTSGKGMIRWHQREGKKSSDRLGVRRRRQPHR